MISEIIVEPQVQVSEEFKQKVAQVATVLNVSEQAASEYVTTFN